MWIDAADFFYAGFWTTPPFSPVRFKTRFFIVVCPPKQTPFAAITELENVEFIEPKSALNLWENGRVLISPPVLIALQELSAAENTEKDREKSAADKRGFARAEEGFRRDSQKSGESQKTEKIRVNPPESAKSAFHSSLLLSAEKLLEKSQNCGGEIDFIVTPGFSIFIIISRRRDAPESCLPMVRCLHRKIMKAQSGVK